MRKYPKVTIDIGEMKAKDLAELSGEIIISLQRLLPYNLVNRTMSSNQIIIEVKPSGIKA